MSTTALYVNSGRLDAELALAAAAPTGFASSSPSPTNAPARLVGQGNPPNQKALCEGEDSNLHGSYPASTSRHARHSDPRAAFAASSPDLALLELLRGEAESLLACAAERRPAELSRLPGFARACLELTEAGRLALAVIDGGVFAPRRALELAEHIVAATESLGASELRSDATGAAPASAAASTSRRRIE